MNHAELSDGGRRRKQHPQRRRAMAEPVGFRGAVVQPRRRVPGAIAQAFCRGDSQRCAHARHDRPRTAGRGATPGCRFAGDPADRSRRCTDGRRSHARRCLRFPRKTLQPGNPARQPAPRPRQTPAGAGKPRAARAGGQPRQTGCHAARRVSGSTDPASASFGPGSTAGQRADSRRNR
ncbi:hypothetical protein D3C76_885330 [compost metagenome]